MLRLMRFQPQTPIYHFSVDRGGKARTWAGSEELLEDYLTNVTSGQQYTSYPFDP
jgi:hypothetical protein